MLFAISGEQRTLVNHPTYGCITPAKLYYFRLGSVSFVLAGALHGAFGVVQTTFRLPPGSRLSGGAQRRAAVVPFAVLPVEFDPVPAC